MYVAYVHVCTLSVYLCWSDMLCIVYKHEIVYQHSVNGLLLLLLLLLLSFCFSWTIRGTGINGDFSFPVTPPLVSLNAAAICSGFGSLLLTAVSLLPLLLDPLLEVLLDLLPSRLRVLLSRTSGEFPESDSLSELYTLNPRDKQKRL